jgi:uncharacterized C2H2 Zn-finger protein
MEIVTEEKTPVQCPDCPETFKSAAGAGRHRTAIHGKRLDGTSVKPTVKRVKTVKETVVTFELAQGVVKISVTPDEANQMLMAHPEKALESLLR